MVEALEKTPGKFDSPKNGRAVNKNGRRVDAKKKPRRSRSRVERPKQKYVYASQRRAMEQLERGKPKKRRLEGEEDEGFEEEETAVESLDPRTQRALLQQKSQREQADFLRGLGFNVASQSADAVVGDGPEETPRIVGTVRLDPEEDAGRSNSFAYVIYKPPGWAILGSNAKGRQSARQTSGPDGVKAASQNTPGAPPTATGGGKSKTKRVRAYDASSDEFTYVSYSEADVLAALTPAERAELLGEGGLNLDDTFADVAKDAMAASEYDDGDDEEELESDERVERKKKKKDKGTATAPAPKANIEQPARPSLVAWLKDLKASEGSPIKGGKNWVALAGATDTDDSGLLLLCPRDRTSDVHVDRVGYVAVVGNSNKLASRSKLRSNEAGRGIEMSDASTATIDIFSRLRRNRDKDPVLAVSVDFPDGASTCSDAALLCQDRLGDGIRGDRHGDPLDRRAPRRLVHCGEMTVSSLVDLDSEPVIAGVEDAPLPDDIAGYADRRDDAQFYKGSFLGRRNGLSSNGLTDAYREVNGAADGYPGWTVDRYGRWLFVQHEEGAPRGPLPSLHDGKTAGVYYLPTKVDRSVMGSEKVVPTLLEGQAAPDFIPINENGINYRVCLGESYSTGIFLDQRPQRTWLASVCNENTRVLNCFAHAGAFSVAAATAGASTVSLDLEKRWLDRIGPQLEDNGISDWGERHDMIYGDCFDWLARLRKRGEYFDIVILDPPSTSVGRKKRRWSVRTDTDELVGLAAPLVKDGGLLVTTTNASTLRPGRFAAMVKKGLDDAGLGGRSRLERVCPMPMDHPSVGTGPVKNLVWTIRR